MKNLIKKYWLVQLVLVGVLLVTNIFTLVGLSRANKDSDIEDKVLYSSCVEAYTTVEMIDCESKRLKEAENDLNKFIQSTEIMQSDTDFVVELNKNINLGLNDTVNSFKQFREKFCHLKGLYYDGGTVQPVVVKSCEVQLTEEFVGNLKAGL